MRYTAEFNVSKKFQYTFESENEEEASNSVMQFIHQNKSLFLDDSWATGDQRTLSINGKDCSFLKKSNIQFIIQRPKIVE